MSESHLSQRRSTQLFAEVDESWAQLLKPSDLNTLRSTCTWKTSLMGCDLQKLEALATREELRKHVKILSIEDGFGQGSETATPETPNVWPRRKKGEVVQEALGLGSFKSMLSERHLSPDKIEIHDRRTAFAPSDREVAAAFVRDILEGADLAITSISVGGDCYEDSFIVAELSAQNQGQGVGLSLLRHAKLTLNYDLSSYWSTQVLYHAPALEQLELSFRESNLMATNKMLVYPQTPLFKLQRLQISYAKLSTENIMAILANSRHSLTSVSLFTNSIKEGSTWRELLCRIGCEFPLLTSFYFKGLGEPVFSGVRNRFRGLNKDSVDERYRSGLELFYSGPPDRRGVSGVKFQGVGAGDLLKTVAAFLVHEPWP